MIIRKPYAFLIKNFKKIHIFLLILGMIIYIKHFKLVTFVKEFVDLGTYDIYNNPISKYIPWYIYFIIIILIIITTLLTSLFKKKNKPWKLYSFQLITYIIMFFQYTLLSNYFNNYRGIFERTQIVLYKDIIFILIILQIPILIIFIIRILGIDLKKFNFQSDEEFLQLTETDQEEIEININLEVSEVKRIYNKLKRNFKYFYQEHKLKINIVIIIITLIIFKNLFTFIFITNKSYKQNQEYNANGYTIVLKEAYYTDKNYKGEKISNKNSFVILKVNIKNNIHNRVVNLGNFHLFNGITDYKITEKLYEESFEDLGIVHTKKELGQNQSSDFMLIYKVSNNLNKKRFVLYYQEYGNNPYLRKIKLNLKDISEVSKTKKLKLGENIDYLYRNKKENIIVDEYQFSDEINYDINICNDDVDCYLQSETKNASFDKKYLIISYGSDTFETKELVDFSTKYGKITYIDSKGIEKELKLNSSVGYLYQGKYLYMLVPKEITDSKKLLLKYNIRNKEYIYVLK